MRHYVIVLKCKSGKLEEKEVCFDNKKQMLHYALDCFENKHTVCWIFNKDKLVMKYIKGNK